MTKKDLIKSLESVSDDFEISVCAVNCTGMDYEAEITNVEINNELHTVYLHLNEDELYNL